MELRYICHQRGYIITPSMVVQFKMSNSSQGIYVRASYVFSASTGKPEESKV